MSFSECKGQGAAMSLSGAEGAEDDSSRPVRGRVVEERGSACPGVLSVGEGRPSQPITCGNTYLTLQHNYFLQPVYPAGVPDGLLTHTGADHYQCAARTYTGNMARKWSITPYFLVMCGTCGPSGLLCFTDMKKSIINHWKRYEGLQLTSPLRLLKYRRVAHPPATEPFLLIIVQPGHRRRSCPHRHHHHYNALGTDVVHLWHNDNLAIKTEVYKFKVAFVISYSAPNISLILESRKKLLWPMCCVSLK